MVFKVSSNQHYTNTILWFYKYYGKNGNISGMTTRKKKKKQDKNAE